MGATTARGGSLVAWSSDDARLQMGSGLRETIKPEEVAAVTEEKRKSSLGREKVEREEWRNVILINTQSCN